MKVNWTRTDMLLTSMWARDVLHNHLARVPAWSILLRSADMREVSLDDVIRSRDRPAFYGTGFFLGTFLQVVHYLRPHWVKTAIFFHIWRLLPPEKKLRQGNVFTPVCHSVHGGGCLPHPLWPEADTLLGRHPSGQTPPGQTPPGTPPPPWADTPRHTPTTLGRHPLG